jgi:putative ABC transport system permease protein
LGFFDLLSLIVDNLGRRKARVALTAVGVVIGTAAIVILVSLGIGLQRNATQSLWGISDLTQISVNPNYGEGPVMVGPGGGGSGSPLANQKLLTPKAIEDLKAIPHVVEVQPRDNTGGEMYYKRLIGYPWIVGVDMADLSQMGLEAQSGSLEIGKGQVVVGPMVAQTFSDPRWRPGDPTPTPPDLQGANLKMVLYRGSSDGTTIRRDIPLRVVGVLTQNRSESDGAMYMTLDQVTALNEWMRGTRINRNKEGYPMVVVKVDDVENVLDVTDQINELGFLAYTPQQYLQGISSFYTVLQVVFGGMGAVALLVAAIGIANTMAMAILERTREIGLMKAVGATNRDVLSVFLGEAAGIGFIGGLGGVLLGWSAGQVINVVAVAYMAGQNAGMGGQVTTVAVVTPTWLPPFALVFATFIGLLSGLYPALRAATLIPVNALKYE